jgi:hypothetical protein
VLKGKEEAKSQLTALEFPVFVTVESINLIAPELIAKSFPSTEHPVAKSTAPLLDIRFP